MTEPLVQCVAWLEAYFHEPSVLPGLPLPAIHHPIFQRGSFTARVLQKLLELVKFGDTVSYQQLAALAGNPKAARAVGGAMRSNPDCVRLCFPPKRPCSWRSHSVAAGRRRPLLPPEAVRGSRRRYGCVPVGIIYENPEPVAAGSHSRPEPCVPILIPCHRVVCSSGAMGNYTGGLATKEWLLAHEGRLAGKPTYPGGSYLAGTRRGALGGTPRPHPAGRDGCVRE
ncbi:methylated-DNA--protein-cysteine methyltransferase isoform X1 [Vulpes lagopus]|uniref:methylated-DNA--protein-cysteine methyltransferase isoform X1 n=1 Tax=Vulpes lagopus TaxID=494514 RepID=UPI001BC8E4B3|nr:methylated-DNA--protein-cysteine methyltransferase isoform X1 [Vulpes lagopus]